MNLLGSIQWHCLIFLVNGLAIAQANDITAYDVRNAVPFNGSTLTNTSAGCNLLNGVLECISGTKLDDNVTGPVDPVFDDFFAFSSQSPGSQLDFFLQSTTNGIVQVVLHFFNSPAKSVGLPSISLRTDGNPPPSIDYTFADNSDLSQTDSTIRNVTLVIENLSIDFLEMRFIFTETKINWFLVSEVDIDGFNSIPPNDSIEFKDGSYSEESAVAVGSVSISCTVVISGSFEWQWKYNGSQLITGDEYQVFIADATRTSILSINEATVIDSGNYSCIANHQNENDNSTRTIALSITSPGPVSTTSTSISDSLMVRKTDSQVRTVSTTTMTTKLTLIGSSMSTTSTPAGGTTGPSSSILPIAIGATIGIIVLLVAIFVVLALILVCTRRKRKMISDLRNMESTQIELRDNGVSSPSEKVKENSELVYSVVQKNKSEAPPMVPPQNFDPDNYNPVDFGDKKTEKELKWGNTGNQKLAKVSKVDGLDLVDNPLYSGDVVPTVQADPAANEPYYSCAKDPQIPESVYSQVTEEINNEAVYSTPGYFDLKNPIYDQADDYSDAQPFNFVSSVDYAEGPIYSVPDVAEKKKRSVMKISKQKLQEIKHLGVGQFGEVVLAKTIGLSLNDLGLSSHDDNTDISINVAVKKVKMEDAQESSLISFEKEMKFMSQLKHENVVQLLAVSEDGIEPFMVMEYMENGDLNQFLLWHQVTQTHPPRNREELSPQNLLSMAIQVADGLAYLATHNYIHRDVATRNCLVGEDSTVKIADFGLSRNLYDSVYYKVKGKAKMPIRWMATECFYGKFSQFSDVWAYGITVWEIYKMGREPPYSNLSDEEVLEDALKGKNRILPDKPAFCPDDVYNLLCTECFPDDYRKRSTFSAIHKHLVNIEKRLYDH